LDSSFPLLRQPELVGVTRAKIRTSWFTAISKNRRIAYAALLLAIVVLTSALYVSRRTQRAIVHPQEFAATLQDYSKTVRGPITHLDLSNLGPDAATTTDAPRSATLFAVDTGSVSLSVGLGARHVLYYHPYDTIVIQYNSDIYVTIRPLGSASLIANTEDTLRPARLSSNAAYYALTEKNASGILSSADSLLSP
jgi:hypothetical protein